MINNFDEVDTEWLANQLSKAGTHGKIDLECWIVNYAKRLDAATDGEAQALLTITDHLGWTQEDDNDVDVVALIKERTPTPIDHVALKKTSKEKLKMNVKMDKFIELNFPYKSEGDS